MRSWGVHVATAVLSAVFFGALVVPGLSADVVLVASDGTQLLASAMAAACCAWAARTHQGRHRRAWWLLSAGTGSWAAGQVVWSVYEVGLRQEVPFPSAADVGFLLFPLLATAGLVTWTSGHRALASRGRDMLDGAIIAASLLVLSWVTTLGSVMGDSGSGVLSAVLSLAYPVGDIILGTLVLIALARTSDSYRGTLLLLGAGLGSLALADSYYVYLVAYGSYSSADWVSGGWVVGFALVASAAAVDVRRPRVASEQPAEESAASPSRLSVALPYLPLSMAGAVVVVSLLTAPVTPVADLLLGVALVVLVLCRQFLAMNENRRLFEELREARDLLHHQALHDPLTALPNRSLFGERLDRALLSREHELAVLFCDLDDFKRVNDELGHDAGDVLLQQVADRLLTCVRATDTVARLGGDEFAILLVDASRADDVASRVVSSMQEPYVLAGQPVRVSISVGVAQHLSAATHVTDRRNHDRRAARAYPILTDPEREVAARMLLTRADTAMYAAKRGGKGRAVLVPPPQTDLPEAALHES